MSQFNQRNFSFELFDVYQVSTADTVFYMYADSEKEKDEWIGAIGRAIVQVHM